MTRPPAEAPMEVDLPDGGRVVVDFADAETRFGDGGNGIAAALLDADGSEGEIEQAILEEAALHGLECSVSERRHPTRVVVRAPTRVGGTTIDRGPAVLLRSRLRPASSAGSTASSASSTPSSTSALRPRPEQP